MLKICVMLGLTLAVGANAANRGVNPPTIYLLTRINKNPNSVMAKYPDAIKLNRKVAPSMNSNGQSGFLITYTLGSRENGDSLISTNSYNDSWSEPQNAKMLSRFPMVGSRVSRVTYVLIDVSQSNDSGGALVMQGGIGKNIILLLMEARNTYWFNYKVSMYGFY